MMLYVLDSDHLSLYQRGDESLYFGVQDLKIAAITLSQNATLLTRNYRDFKRIPRLQLDDWSSPAQF